MELAWHRILLALHRHSSLIRYKRSYRRFRILHRHLALQRFGSLLLGCCCCYLTVADGVECVAAVVAVVVAVVVATVVVPVVVAGVVAAVGVAVV